MFFVIIYEQKSILKKKYFFIQFHIKPVKYIVANRKRYQISNMYNKQIYSRYIILSA